MFVHINATYIDCFTAIIPKAEIKVNYKHKPSDKEWKVKVMFYNNNIHDQTLYWKTD